MGRKRVRPKTPASIAAAARTEAPSQEEKEEEEDEQVASDASTRTPSAKRRAKSGERRAVCDVDDELDPLSAEEGGNACRFDIGISIGGASAAFVDKVASRLPGRGAQVAALTRLLDQVRTC